MNDERVGNGNGEAILEDTACCVLKFEACSVASKYWTFHGSRQGSHPSHPEILLGNEESTYA